MLKIYKMPPNGRIPFGDTDAKTADILEIGADVLRIETLHLRLWLEHVSEVRVSPENERFASVDGILYSKDMKELIWYPRGKVQEEYKVPDSVTTLNANSVWNAYIKRVTGGVGLTKIHAEFLPLRFDLEEIKINNAAYVSVSGVLYDKAMTELLVCPRGVLADLEIDSLRIIRRGAMNYNRRVSDVVFSDSLEEIEDGAFVGSSIVSVTGGYGLKSIGNQAFARCEKFEIAVFQEGLIHIGAGAFNKCKALKELVIPASVRSIGTDRSMTTISKKTTIVCQQGTYAEGFAIKHGFTRSYF